MSVMEARTLFETSFLRARPPVDVNHRMDVKVVISCKLCNLNGEADSGKPRQDQESGHGLASGVCLKRHIRDTMAALLGDRPGFQIYVTRKAILEHKQIDIYNAAGIPIKKGKNGGKKGREEGADEDDDEAVVPVEDGENVRRAKAWACKTWVDVRNFGAVMTMRAANCGQVRGAWTVPMAVTVDPVLVVDEAITCSCLHSEEEAKTNRMLQTFGDRPRIAFGLYVDDLQFSPAFGQDVGYSSEDMEVFFEALGRLFEYTRSASRDRVYMEQVIVFEHNNPLGCAPAHRLFRLVDIARKDPTKPARDVSDYTITAKEEVERRVQELGYKGVTVHYLL